MSNSITDRGPASGDPADALPALRVGAMRERVSVNATSHDQEG